MKQLAALAIGVSLAAIAHGQTYRCTGPDGGTVFQDRPCTESEEGESGKLDLHVAPSDAENARRLEAERQRREIDRAKEERAQRLEDAVRRREVMLGMSKRQAERAWGEPDRINPTTSRQGHREQWVYRRAGGRSQYLYFENGELVTIQ